MSPRLLIGEVAGAVGVNVQTVRYYERRGLLPPADRTPSGYRVYPPQTLDRLTFIRQAQALGFRLDEIREILRIKYGGQSPCTCVRDALHEKLAEVETQMADLTRFRRQLKATLRRAQTLPRLSHHATTVCPLIESSSSANRKKNQNQKGRKGEK